MKKLIALLFTVLISIVANVKADEFIQVVTEEWKPYNYQENGIIKGPSTELVRKVLRRANIAHSIRLYPWARAYKRAIEEKNVLIYTIVRTPEREASFKWVRPIALSDDTYLYKLGERKDIVINSLEDAKKYQVGVVRESMYHQYLLRNGFSDNLQIVSKAQQNFDKLKMRRIDLLAESKNNLNQYNSTGIPIEEVFHLFHYPYYMAFSNHTSDEIVEKVKAAFDQLQAEGEL